MFGVERILERKSRVLFSDIRKYLHKFKKIVLINTYFFQIPSTFDMMSEEDKNTNVSVSEIKSKCINIVASNINNRNLKDIEAVNFPIMNNYFSPLTFFNH